MILKCSYVIGYQIFTFRRKIRFALCLVWPVHNQRPKAPETSSDLIWKERREMHELKLKYIEFERQFEEH